VPVLVALTVLLALIGTTLACLNTGVRVTYSMARDREVPSVLGLLHGKYATPHAGVWILVAVSALFGIYGVQPAQTDNITQITLASNTGTFLVYGLTCVIAVVAFAHRHDRRFLAHYAVPGLGALMNVAEMVGVIYLAIQAGGNATDDAYKALAIVGVWILIGIAWVALNPRMRGSKLFDATAPKRETTPVGV
jgi:amino acid transporter